MAISWSYPMPFDEFMDANLSYCLVPPVLIFIRCLIIFRLCRNEMLTLGLYQSALCTFDSLIAIRCNCRQLSIAAFHGFVSHLHR